MMYMPLFGPEFLKPLPRIKDTNKKSSLLKRAYNSYQRYLKQTARGANRTQENARRRRQIAKGMLTASNGLIKG